MPTSPKLDPRPVTPVRPTRPPSMEQRRHPRFELPVRCWIMSEEHTVYLQLHDLSRGGLSVRAPVPFVPPSAINLQIELPQGGVVRARGEVVWVRRSDERVSGPRMGARFIEVIEGESDLLKLTES
jgi:hypothetical protein